MLRWFVTSVVCSILGAALPTPEHAHLVNLTYTEVGPAEVLGTVKGHFGLNYKVLQKTFLSSAVWLKPGQMVFTLPEFDIVPRVSGAHYVLGIRGDIVMEGGGGQYVPTPLSEVYDHHWIIRDFHHYNYLCPKHFFSDLFGAEYIFGIGSESRNSPVRIPNGFGYYMPSYLRLWGANLHFLRIDNGEHLEGSDPKAAVKHCVECYYQRDKVAPGCSSWTNGDFACCGESCQGFANCYCPRKSTAPRTSKAYYLRYTVTYTTDTQAVKPIEIGLWTAPNCETFYAVRANGGQHDVQSKHWKASFAMEIMFLIGHQHVGAVKIEVYLNNKWICASYPTYGTGTAQDVGNEGGYVVKMSECYHADDHGGKGIKVRKGDQIRIDSVYDSSEEHLNVMGYMYAAYCRGSCKMTLPPAPSPTNIITITSRKDRSNKKCLDLKGGSASAGTAVQLWDCNGLDNQQWIFDDWRIMYAKDVSLCLDVAGGNLKAGATLQIWQCNGSPQQKFGYDAASGTTYLAGGGTSDASLCIDIAGGSTSAGTPVQLWGCNGLVNQQWLLWDTGPVRPITITTQASQGNTKCLDLPGGYPTEGTQLQMWECNGKSSQQWLFDNYRLIYVADTSMCVDISGGKIEGGTRLQLWSCNGLPGQSFGYDETQHTIYAAGSTSDASLCMDLAGGKADDGAAIQLWSCNRHINQMWNLWEAPHPLSTSILV